MIGTHGRHGVLVAHDVEKDIEQGDEPAPPNHAMAPPNRKLCALPSGVVGTEQGPRKFKTIHSSNPGELGHHAVKAVEVAKELVNDHAWDQDVRVNSAKRKSVVLESVHHGLPGQTSVNAILPAEAVLLPGHGNA